MTKLKDSLEMEIVNFCFTERTSWRFYQRQSANLPRFLRETTKGK